MYDFPMEGTVAGDTLAVILVIAPIVAALLGYLQKPRFRAFVLALLAASLVLVAGIGYAVQSAPGQGTWVMAGALGGWGFLLSTMTAGVTVGARAIGVPVVDEPAADASREGD